MLVTIIVVGIIDFDYLYGKQFIYLEINFEVEEGIVKI